MLMEVLSHPGHGNSKCYIVGKLSHWGEKFTKNSRTGKKKKNSQDQKQSKACISPPVC